MHFILKEGEAQVVVSLFNHGKFLCIKGQVLHLAGDRRERLRIDSRTRDRAGTVAYRQRELSEAIAELAGLLE